MRMRMRMVQNKSSLLLLLQVVVVVVISCYCTPPLPWVVHGFIPTVVHVSVSPLRSSSSSSFRVLQSNTNKKKKKMNPLLLQLHNNNYNNDDDYDDNDPTNVHVRRKRDIIKKCWGSHHHPHHWSLLSSRLYPRTTTTTTNTRGTAMRLHRGKHNDDNSNNENKDKDNNNEQQHEEKKIMSLLRIPPFFNKANDDNGDDGSGVVLLLMERMTVLWESFQNVVPSLRLAVFSFVAGMVLTLTIILIPVYQQVESLAEPVTLFETILSDLDRSYVDPINTRQLFETGMAAMLNSLDPYTEFEGQDAARELTESIGGMYGGVGLVISGTSPKDLALYQKEQQQQQEEEATAAPTTTTTTTEPNVATLDPHQRQPEEEQSTTTTTTTTTTPMSTSSSPFSSFMESRGNNDNDEEEEEEDGLSLQDRLNQRRLAAKARERGIRVVSAFEGYAFDYGLRVGDKLLSVDQTDISKGTSVDQVRNLLRGEPGTYVTIEFEREGVKDVQTVTMPRTVVQIRNVKLATLVGNPQNGIGYIQLTGFASNAGHEVEQAILGLQRAAEVASNGEHSLQGLLLDMRGNPGGLLTSAVDVASLLVPKGSDIVSAKGRGFPGVIYRSRVDPVLQPNTKLAVLVNGGTASAAEIVSGAVQDLDVGVIVGSDRTFGKGLVQNVEDLPFNTALKFTVAKYYTPSGRCIQGIQYTEGDSDDGGKYKESKVADKDRGTFYTRLGRQVRDGGGIEADYKVAASKASALEVTLLRSGVFGEFAALWSKTHELTNNINIVDDKLYNEFQAFVNQKQKEGDIQLEALYTRPIKELKKVLKQSGYKGSSKELDQLQASIVREVQKDFEKYKSDIKEDLQQSILARYLPERMLIERGLKSDQQVAAAIKLVSNGRQFDNLLARGSSSSSSQMDTGGTTLNTASNQPENGGGARLNLKW